jgi:hypothetical protein
MANAARAIAEPSKEDRLREIEHKHFRQCLWQLVSPNRRMLVECMEWPAAKTTAIVVKHYDAPIPRGGSSKPWPNMIAGEIYVPADPGNNTWEGLDAALTKFEE